MKHKNSERTGPQEISQPDAGLAPGTLADIPASSPRPRRTQEDRSRETRQRLLNAAIDLLMSDGYRGFSTKEVARRAGLSNGALAHHYANKAELVAAAAAAAHEECMRHRDQYTLCTLTSQDPLQGFIDHSLRLFFDRPFLAVLEIFMAARTDPELLARVTPIMKHYRETIDAQWLKAFCEAGYSPQTAQLILNLTLNITRGMALNRLWQNDEQNYRVLLEEWSRIVQRQFSPSRTPPSPPP